jgi:diadenosine tetraphosphate (Ap4A) HIT family hydrolase
MHFDLHPNLAEKIFITDLPLCRVLLEDETNYPWIFLVPRRAGLSRIVDLPFSDQIQLLKELNLAQNIFLNEFKADQINVAAIGNKTPQLHVHVIARRQNDPAWPSTVWEHRDRSKYTEESKQAMVLLLRKEFERL